MKPRNLLLRFAVLVFCLSALQATDAVAQGVPQGTVRVTAEVLNVRNGPGIKFRVINRVGRGTLLKVINVQNGWLQVRRPAGVLGWVYSGGTVRVN